MKLTPLAPALGALTLCLTACGGRIDPDSETTAGYASLGSGDAQTALDRFVDALDALGPDDPGYARARMGAVEAKARLWPAAAAESLLDWARTRPEQVTAEDHRKVGALLAELGAFAAAIDVLHAGAGRFPDDARLVSALDSMHDAAAARGDDAVFARIAGLGYGGG